MRHPFLSLRPLLAFVVAVQLTSSARAESPDGWRKVHDENGVVVYQRDLDGVSTISLKGEATIDARVQDIFAIMANNAEAHEWMPLVRDKRDLRTVSPTERIEYTHIGMPWPMADRYFINQGKAEYRADGSIKISVKSVDEDPVQDASKVLGILHVSEFMLTPIDDGRRTHMTLEVNSDPKGLIPKWIVNVAQKSWPLDFFSGLTRQLTKHGKLGSAPLSH